MKKFDTYGFSPLEINTNTNLTLVSMNDRTSLSIKSLTGFTLIELLIVVAIIAILAAIAIPNFLAAQVRSKVSRVRADLRSAATALETYYVDNNSYPLMRGAVAPNLTFLNRPEDTNGWNQPCSRSYRTIPVELTTPIAYITSIFRDPFKATGVDYGFSSPQDTFNNNNSLDKGYVYHNIQEWIDNPGNGYNDQDMVAYGSWRLVSLGPDNRYFNNIGRTIYDPSNGTVSNGDVIRTQKSAAGERNDPTSGTD